MTVRARLPNALLGAALLAACATGDEPPARPPPERPAAALEPVSPDSVLRHVRALPADRHPGGSGSALARRRLREALEGWGYAVDEQVFRWEGLPGLDLVNLEARLPGPSPDAPIVVVGAHWDAVPRSPGADDNGSGVAVVLEVARRLAGRRLSAEVRFQLYDAEEVGLVGSREVANGLTDDERSRIVGVLDLETVGYTDRRPGSQEMPPGSRLLHDPGTVGDFVLVVGNQDSRRLAATVGLALGAEDPEVMRPEVFSELPGTGWLLPDSRRSDHASFWDVGVPAVMLTDTANFRNPHYHRPSDRVETLDGAFLAAVARGVERAVLLLSESEG